MSEILTLNNVDKTIKGKAIINNLSFSVQEGEVFGLLGPNGAGKTTTIRMIVGLIKMTKGDIAICGHSIKTNFEQAIEQVGAIVENPEMYKHLTGYENLKQYARMHKDVDKKRIDEMIELIGLKDRIHDKVKTYSLGMRQRLGLAQCLLHHPKLLILDEPTNGLDPAGIREIRDHLQHLTKEKGMSVIVSSHLLSEMEMMCDRIAIIQNGTLTDIQDVRNFVNDEKNEYIFETSAIDSIQVWLTQEWSVTLTETGFSVMTTREHIPTIIKKLVEENISIYEVKQLTKTLEDRFLEVTSANGGQ
ncbi:ABC transporter ATP-binding protein [Halalkalibacter sp. APA_J-10(15)]|uniref:ABC transporter ATP-binding protein n=1 Tax=unclassified Halalkalibacter TaxID=2893063 RepID=UPI001FF30A07|nr:ABC transporter ATP-binding protein [Halalkalibacter sp. APA_J-10(15)]MCK0472843.1 ABC transporter ATP-binding protein [Halalkalibacter sp. APA_J-10(15)]